MKQLRSSIFVLVLAITFITTTAAAKDLHNTLGDLVGVKMLTAKILTKTPANAFAKPKLTVVKLPARRIEFLYTGYMGLKMIDQYGVREVSIDGMDCFEWTDAGYLYRIEDYPYDNAHAPIQGWIYQGKAKVGKFEVVAKALKAQSVGGRWLGELAFPGGKSLPIGFHIAELGMSSGKGCATRLSQVQFPGHGEQEAWVTGCDDGDSTTSFSAGFFFLDDRSNSRWFVAIQATHDVFTDGSDAFQGSVWMLPLSGQGSAQEGKLLTFRPPKFSL